MWTAVTGCVALIQDTIGNAITLFWVEKEDISQLENESGLLLRLVYVSTLTTKIANAQLKHTHNSYRTSLQSSPLHARQW